MTTAADLRLRLAACPAGSAGWYAFEQVCIDALTYLFVPPLMKPLIQPRTYSGIDRRDAVFPNRHDIGDSNWARLHRELDVRLLLFEFKNYDKSDVGKDEVNQTHNYLKGTMGRLAILCSNKTPVEAAHIKRNAIYSEFKKMILFLSKDQLLEMIAIKERRDDPSDLLMDMVELFYLQHE